MSRPRQLPLDMLRGIAILLVLIFHFQVPTGFAPVDTAVRPFAAAGWAGVDLFFVLSGYLVGGMILAEVGRTARFDWRRFFARRALRLWPVLWLYLGAVLVLGGGWSMVWPVFLHVQNYAGELAVPSHLWSLAVEEHFYLLAAVTLPWLARRGGGAVVAALIAVIVAVGALRIGALAAGETLRHAQWQTQYRIDALAVGVLIAAARLYYPAHFAAAGRWRWPLILGAVAAFGWLASGSEDAVRYGIGRSVAWAASAALVLAAADAAVPRAFAAPAHALGWLGTIAYSLYVWHASAGFVADALCRSLGLSTPAPVFATKLLFAIAVGAVIYRWVERPFLELRDRPKPGTGFRQQLA